MAIDFHSTAPVPEAERVIEVLDDDACRETVSALEEPGPQNERIVSTGPVAPGKT